MFKIQKVATFILVGAFTILSKTAVAQASEEPVAGMAVILEEFYQNAEETDEVAVHNLFEELSVINNLAFAQVSSYVNIRSKASEEGEILGKLYDNAAATILGEEDGWYKIKSGSVTGYIKGDYLVTGNEAATLAKKVGTKMAVVDTTTLKVRAKATTESDVLTLVAIGDDLKVVKELEGWAKVEIEENTYGYVSTDYVKLQMIYEEALSMEEERERLEEEEAANNQSQNNNSSGSNSNTSSNSSPNNNTSNNGTSGSNSSSSSSLGNKIADYAVQFVGNPYVWGGTSLTNGADCSGFTQSVFRHFGISIPRTSRTQAAGGTRVSLDNLRAGDLLFYARGGTINHVGIYIGNGKVISASSPSTGIRITSYNYRTPVKAVRYH